GARRVVAAAAAPFVGAAAMLDALAVWQLVAEAALQPPAHPGQLRRIEAEVLLLRHPDRDRLEALQPRGAAQRPAARSVAAEHLGLVADADLPHLDATAEVSGEIADQLAEVDPSLGRVVKDQPRSV